MFVFYEKPVPPGEEKSQTEEAGPHHWACDCALKDLFKETRTADTYLGEPEASRLEKLG